jgi:hypothetical protein
VNLPQRFPKIGPKGIVDCSLLIGQKPVGCLDVEGPSRGCGPKLICGMGVMGLSHVSIRSETKREGQIALLKSPGPMESSTSR